MISTVLAVRDGPRKAVDGPRTAADGRRTVKRSGRKSRRRVRDIKILYASVRQTGGTVNRCNNNNNRSIIVQGPAEQTHVFSK